MRAEFGDWGHTTKGVRHARTLRLAEVGAAALSDVNEAVDTLLALEAAFLGKYEHALAADPFAAVEIRALALEQLLVAAARVVVRPASSLARKVAGALLGHVRALGAVPGGGQRAARLGWDTLLRLTLGGRRYHERSGRLALRAALHDPVNRRSLGPAAAGD
jgi:hypothetical protein